VISLNQGITMEIEPLPEQSPNNAVKTGYSLAFMVFICYPSSFLLYLTKDPDLKAVKRL